jgi:hypothetical protein
MIAHELLEGSCSTTAILASSVVGMCTLHGQPALTWAAGVLLPISQGHCSAMQFQLSYLRQPLLAACLSIIHACISVTLPSQLCLIVPCVSTLTAQWLLLDKLWVWLRTNDNSSIIVAPFDGDLYLENQTSDSVCCSTFAAESLCTIFFHSVYCAFCCSIVFSLCMEKNHLSSLCLWLMYSVSEL